MWRKQAAEFRTTRVLQEPPLPTAPRAKREPQSDRSPQRSRRRGNHSSKSKGSSGRGNGAAAAGAAAGRTLPAKTAARRTTKKKIFVAPPDPLKPAWVSPGAPATGAVAADGATDSPHASAVRLTMDEILAAELLESAASQQQPRSSGRDARRSAAPRTRGSNAAGGAAGSRNGAGKKGKGKQQGRRAPTPALSLAAFLVAAPKASKKGRAKLKPRRPAVPRPPRKVSSKKRTSKLKKLILLERGEQWLETAEAIAEAERLVVGSRCTTFAGSGTVIEMCEDGMVAITLDWTLAQGQGATAHFNGESVAPSAFLSAEAEAAAAAAAAAAEAEAAAAAADAAAAATVAAIAAAAEAETEAAAAAAVAAEAAAAADAAALLRNIPDEEWPALPASAAAPSRALDHAHMLLAEATKPSATAPVPTTAAAAAAAVASSDAADSAPKPAPAAPKPKKPLPDADKVRRLLVDARDRDPQDPVEFGASKVELFTELRKVPRPARVLATRDYVTQSIDVELDAKVKMILSRLIEFQRRAHQKNPVKAKFSRRLVMGLREVKRDVTAKRLRCVVVAPDIAAAAKAGSLNDQVALILERALMHNIPIVFALNKRRLGKAVGKRVKISVIGILSYDGVGPMFQEMLVLHKAAKARWVAEQKEQQAGQEEQEEPILADIASKGDAAAAGAAGADVAAAAAGVALGQPPESG